MKKKITFLKSIEIERNKRINSKYDYYKNLMLFWNKFLKKNKKKNFIKLRNAFVLAKNLRYNHGGKVDNKYFFHTLRVASMILFWGKKEVKNDLLVLALLHNCFETTKVKDQFIENLFGKKIIDEINLLTVNRKNQWDKIYKANYYKKIINSSKNTRIVKVFDKLDNLFVLNKNPNLKIKIRYLAEVKKYIIPIVKKDVSLLLNYFEKLIDDTHLTIHGKKKYL